MTFALVVVLLLVAGCVLPDTSVPYDRGRGYARGHAPKSVHNP